MTIISEPKSFPVSAYLSPRAYLILKDFHEGSLYGSMSRTIEEIILAFSDIYNLATVIQEARKEGKGFTADAKNWMLSQMETIATSRLKLTTLEKSK